MSKVATPRRESDKGSEAYQSFGPNTMKKEIFQKN
jgi:hypothetical protein